LAHRFGTRAAAVSVGSDRCAFHSGTLRLLHDEPPTGASLDRERRRRPIEVDLQPAAQQQPIRRGYAAARQWPVRSSSQSKVICRRWMSDWRTIRIRGLLTLLQLAHSPRT
jgi:hypothetical protein